METYGFVTIATGHVRYYQMAINLLRSIKYTNPNSLVGIITDKGNDLISEFDKVVILDNPYSSYLDKLYLLKNCPFDRNIFIDADSLVYGDISYLWDDFHLKTDFSCLGEQHPLNYKDGFFTYENVKNYKKDINYIPRLHGGLYYIKKGKFCDEMLELCLDIKDNYYTFNFAIFKKPADEPIIALASSIKKVSFVNKINDICFFPIVDIDSINRKDGLINYTEYEKKYVGKIIHFSNSNTNKPFYKIESIRFKMLYEKNRINYLILFFYKMKCFYKYYFGSYKKIKSTLYDSSPQFIKELWHKFKKGEF